MLWVTETTQCETVILKEHKNNWKSNDITKVVMVFLKDDDEEEEENKWKVAYGYTILEKRQF